MNSEEPFCPEAPGMSDHPKYPFRIATHRPATPTPTPTRITTTWWNWGDNPLQRDSTSQPCLSLFNRWWTLICLFCIIASKGNLFLQILMLAIVQKLFWQTITFLKTPLTPNNSSIYQGKINVSKINALFSKQKLLFQLTNTVKRGS